MFQEIHLVSSYHIEVEGRIQTIEVFIKNLASCEQKHSLLNLKAIYDVFQGKGTKLF